MLVLTRKLMEKLFIGDDICVTVVRLEAGQVRLGIEAPREVPVVRAELVTGREPHPPHPAPNGHSSPAKAPVRHSPYGAHGNGSRPRGRSR
jgi:carbon storage regulator